MGQLRQSGLLGLLGQLGKCPTGPRCPRCPTGPTGPKSPTGPTYPSRQVKDIVPNKKRPEKGRQANSLFEIFLSKTGTRGGNRTHTPLREQDFESSASANSATLALVC